MSTIIEDSVGPNGVRITTINLTCSDTDYIVLLQHHELTITNQENYEFCGLSLIITSTQWDFFLSKVTGYEEVRKALIKSVPTKVDAGYWHLPFVTKNDDTALDCIMDSRSHPNCWREYKDVDEDYAEMSMVNISATRCFTYKDEWNIMDVEDNLDKAAILRGLRNWSPFEHQAQAVVAGMDFCNLPTGMEMRAKPDGTTTFWSANFQGWIQGRALMENS